MAHRLKMLSSLVTIGGALVLTSLPACGQSALSSTNGMGAAVLNAGDASVRLNAGAGQWSEMVTYFNAGDGQQIDMLLDQRNYDDKWAPMMSVCVKGKELTRLVCAKLSWTVPDRPLLQMAKSSQSADLKTEEYVMLGGDFGVGKVIHLSVTVVGNVVSFKADNGISTDYTIDFAPAQLRLGCSSAQCSFLLR